MIFDVMKANDKNDHDAADIVCDECKSIIATLHGPSTHRAGVRTGRAEKARAMAGQEIDRLWSAPLGVDGYEAVQLAICRACSSSKLTGLLYPSAEWRRLAL